MDMRRMVGVVGRLCLGGALFAGPVAAFAGNIVYGSISYAPMAGTAVPTLSEWGMVAMALLLAVLAYRLLRNQLGGRPLASLVLAGALGLGMASGVPSLRSANAVAVTPVVSLGTAAGGTAYIGYTGLNEITNTSGVPLTITSLQALNGAAFGGLVTPPACTVGMALAPGGHCYVNLELND